MSQKFEMTRVFAVSRERMWEAWTRPEQIAQWLSPKGTKSEVRHFDLRPGGYLHSRLEAPDGTITWGKNMYREIERPRKLVWAQGFSNEAGDIVAAPFPMPWPLLLTTVVFEEIGPRETRVTLTWEPLDPTDEQRTSFETVLPSMTGGWTGSFDQLDALLAAR